MMSKQEKDQQFYNQVLEIHKYELWNHSLFLKNFPFLLCRLRKGGRDRAVMPFSKSEHRIKPFLLLLLSWLSGRALLSKQRLVTFIIPFEYKRGITWQRWKCLSLCISSGFDLDWFSRLIHLSSLEHDKFACCFAIEIKRMSQPCKTANEGCSWMVR